MRGLAWMALGLAATTVAVVACEYPAFDFRTHATGGSGQTSSGGGGHAGVGGDGGGMGGSGGGGTGGCGPQHEICLPAEKCSVVDTSTGAHGCVEAGPRPAWAKCLDDLECADGLWCDTGGTGVCKPVCASGNNCALGAQCVPALAGGGSPIAGLKVCTAHCEPLSAAPCVQTFGGTNCLLISGGEFDCASTTVAGAEGALCTTARQCAPSLLCVDDGGGFACHPWCEPVNALCGGLGWCSQLTPVVTYEGTEYGACL